MHLRRITLESDRFPDTDHYPFDQPVLRRTPSIDLDAPVTFFTGENGTGKSTLLEAVVRRSGIHIWRDAERTALDANPYLEALQHFVELEWTDGCVPGAFFSSSSFRHFTYTVDQWASADRDVLEFFGGSSLVSQSHGQSIMAYLRSRCWRRGIFLMDEPETALSPQSQLGLVRLLHQAGASGEPQFIIATHSPILLACPEATIYSFDHVPIRRMEYSETPLFRIYRDFLADPAAALEKQEI